MDEFKDFLPLVGVLIGAIITTFSQWVLAQKQNNQASQKLKIDKTEETLESIAYIKKMIAETYRTMSKNYKLLRTLKKEKLELPPSLDVFWKHEAKISMLVNTYFPQLSEDYNIVEKIMIEHSRIREEKVKRLEEMSVEQISNEEKQKILDEVEISIEDNAKEIDKHFKELEEKIYSELRKLIN